MDYSTVDGYSYLGEIYKLDSPYHRRRHRNLLKAALIKFYTYWTKETRAVIACLVITGVVTGFIAMFCEYSINALHYYRKVLVGMMTNRWELQFVFWLGWAFVFCAIAGFCPKYISVYASGSGIPEMKTIMSGIEMPQYLSLRTLVAKVVGIICAQAAELYLGRVGPFVHIGACVCHQILRLPFLKTIRDNYHLRMQMLAAACSLGPAAVFGAPVGGVFFSIEVTATFFYVHSLWKGILCAVCAKIAHSYFRGTTPFLPGTAFSSIYEVEYGLHPFTGVEFIVLIFAGTVVAVIGAMFTVCVKRYVMFRSRYNWWKTSLWGQLCFAGLIIACVSYPASDLTFGQYDSFRSLVSSDDLEGQQMSKWDVILALFIVGLLKFVLIIICGTLPIASGLFAPSVMLGAHIGRMIGEILDALFPNMIRYPAGFALMGMTAFPCATTSTFSPAVITVETIGDLSYLVPCLLVSVISYSIGEMVNGSIYNVMIRFRKMPYLSANLSPKFTGRLAHEVMDENMKLLTYHTTINQIKELYKDADKDQTSFPIVDNKDSMMLIGAAQRRHIDQLFEFFPDESFHDKPLTMVYRYQNTRHSKVSLREFDNTDKPVWKDFVAELPEEHFEEPVDTRGWCNSCWDIKGFDPDAVKEAPPQPVEIKPLEEIPEDEEEEEFDFGLPKLELPKIDLNIDAIKDKFEPINMENFKKNLQKVNKLVPKQLRKKQDDNVPLETISETKPEEESVETSEPTDLEEETETKTEVPEIKKVEPTVKLDEPVVTEKPTDTKTVLTPAPFKQGKKITFDLQVADKSMPWLEFDPAPYQTPVHTPLVKIQYAFSMLTLTQVLITFRGKLVGVITKRKLLANPDRKDIPFGG